MSFLRLEDFTKYKCDYLKAFAHIHKFLTGKRSRPWLTKKGIIHDATKEPTAFFFTHSSAVESQSSWKSQLGSAKQWSWCSSQQRSHPTSSAHASPTRFIVGYNQGKRRQKRLPDFFNVEFIHRLSAFMPNGATFLTNPDPWASTPKLLIDKLATLLVGRLLTHLSLRLLDETKHQH